MGSTKCHMTPEQAENIQKFVERQAKRDHEEFLKATRSERDSDETSVAG